MVQNVRSLLLILPCFLPTWQTNSVYVVLAQSLMLLEGDLFTEMCPWYLYLVPHCTLQDLQDIASQPLLSSRVCPCPCMRLPCGYFQASSNCQTSHVPMCCIKSVWCQKLVLIAWISAWKTLLFEWSLFLLVAGVHLFPQPSETTLAGSRRFVSGERSEEAKKEGHRTLT